MCELKRPFDDNMTASEYLNQRRLFADVVDGPIWATPSIDDLLESLK